IRPVLRLFSLTGSWNDRQPIPQAVSVLIEGLDAEVQQIARAYKAVVPGFSAILREFCERPGQSLQQQLPLAFGDIAGESTNYELSVKILAAETRDTLVLLEEFARLAHMAVPIIDSVIELA